jgi:hypothetical protein
MPHFNRFAVHPAEHIFSPSSSNSEEFELRRATVREMCRATIRSNYHGDLQGSYQERASQHNELDYWLDQIQFEASIRSLTTVQRAGIAQKCYRGGQAKNIGKGCSLLPRAVDAVAVSLYRPCRQHLSSTCCETGGGMVHCTFQSVR